MARNRVAIPRAAAAAVLVLCLSAAAGIAVKAAPVPRGPAEYILLSCNVTRFPDLCAKSLVVYAPAVRRSPRRLAQAALAVTEDRALAASSFVRGMSVGGRKTTRGSLDGGAVRDCVETLADGVDRLRRSLKEMGRLGRYGSSNFSWHLSNVQTWVSAALTDDNTCLDSLSQDRSAAVVRLQIRRQIVHVARLTSNALALINRLDPNY
ncbi:21 kDa protein [Apostasia shenzhenica]|uniref:21 kDa protein n=1 Tax=Apostasia shenzhenica TaxID=1088818 RepID=A0A2I0AFA8_9ASPA|nr:21 kDa protein [Apostasia shenzhenica]